MSTMNQYRLRQMQASSEYLLQESAHLCPGRMLVMPQYSPGSSHIQPGQVKLGESEIKPNCIGVVVAIACDADTAQSLLDALLQWTTTA